MAERPQQTYQCHSQGCTNGYGSEFSAAPEEWFKAKGFTPPKNCPTCRAWIKQQTDESTWCTNCNTAIRIPARYKISHHKRVGVWKLPEICRRCERGQPLKKAVAERPKREKTLKPVEKESDDFTTVADGIPVQNRKIATDPRAYQYDDGKGQTRQRHIERHIADSGYESDNKSPSALAAGPDAFQTLLGAAAELFVDNDPVWNREYQEGGRIVRLTYFDTLHIEKTIIEAEPGPYGHIIVTTFDNNTVEWALNNYGSKEDKGQV